MCERQGNKEGENTGTVRKVFVSKNRKSSVREKEGIKRLRFRL